MVPHAPMGLTLRRTPRSFVLAGLLAFTVPVAAAPAVSKAPLSAAAQPLPAAAEDDRLLALFRADARRQRQLDPLEVLYQGRKADTAAFAQLFTPERDHALRELAARALADLSMIDRSRLSSARQLSYDAFAHDRRRDLAALSPAGLRMARAFPITHFGGLHAEFPELVAREGPLPFADADDYRRNLALLQAWPKVVDAIIARFRDGLAQGLAEHEAPVRNMITQIDAILAVAPEQSPFASATREFPASIEPAWQARLRSDYDHTVRRQVYPAYRALRSFLASEYLPQARRTPGISALPGGAVHYRQLIAQQTTLNLEPEAIHELGIGEVARIQGEMLVVARKLGFQGSLRAFFGHVRTDPRYHPRTAEELHAGFERVAARVDSQLPRFFLHSPRTKLSITPYPAYLSRFQAGGSYEEGAADGSRPGVFYYNTYDLPNRFLTGIATLYLHEGAPGHHFQISLAKENAQLPDFQRRGGNSAFVEGWALYAETLGYAMGLYDDPLQHWGTLDDEMLRAMRLVVDTGIHAKGWSRDVAVSYMLANSGMGRSDAEAEVDRYIAKPAQALSYKIGAMTIQRLRTKAEAALGAQFDLRHFHDQVLGSGALPLPVLEAKIDGWIAAQIKQ